MFSFKLTNNILQEFLEGVDHDEQGIVGVVIGWAGTLENTNHYHSETERQKEREM